MEQRPEIAIVEDEPNLRELLTDLLRAEGYEVVRFHKISEAESRLSSWEPDVLVLDVKLPDGDGLSFLDRLRARGYVGPAIVMTAFGTIDRAVQALRAGACDFLVKPFDNERLLGAVAGAIESRRRVDEVALTAGTVEPSSRAIIGAEGGLKEVVFLLPRIAASEATVLIRGESGTGKELIARAIHATSSRLDGPFVSLNCAALPPSLLEAELFGFERGAFTGAHAQRKGLVESADGGTLFLDEIGDMSLEAQVRLLRVLQEREITRVGGREAVGVDVRVIAATHRDLETLVKSGGFRQDLLYRLDVVPIRLPPLRERRDDIPGLIEHFLAKHAKRHKVTAPEATREVLAWAKAQPWPGNVRELENFVERAVVMGRFEVAVDRAAVKSAPPEERSSAEPAEIRTLREVVATAERNAVIGALRAARGNKAHAARMLGVSYKTLFNKIHEHGIKEESVFD
jgi:two-component system, NtrC family, response regulator AtoC